MARPARAITTDDQWRAYQCELLEEIRDLLREMRLQMARQFGGDPQTTVTTTASPNGSVEVVKIRETKPRPARGAKGGGTRGKDV